MIKSKKWISIVLTLLLVLAMIPASSASASEKVTSTDGNWGILADYYNKTCTIYGYYGSEANLKIPEKIDGLKVTKYILSTGGNSWTNNYKNRNAIVTVEVPNTVTELGYGSFANLPNLKSVTIPSSVKTYGESLLADCTSLEEFTLPSHMKQVPAAMFAGCTSLKTVTLHNAVTSLGDSAFAGCTSLRSIKLPSKLKTIGYNCFGVRFTDKCGLESISIPNTVTSIGSKAFISCENLASVKLSTGLTKIDSNTFEGCTSLKSVTIPSKCNEVSYEAFYNCDNLTTVVIRGNAKLPEYKGPFTPSALLTIYSASAETQVTSYCKSQGVAWKSLNPPKFTSKKRTATSATLKWSKVSGATGYNVYMKTGTGSYKLVKTTTALSFKKTGLKKGVTYRFYVTTLKKDDLDQTIESKASAVYKTYLKK